MVAETSQLSKCIAFTHSHVQQWHSLDESGFPYADCCESDEYQLFEDDFIDFKISVDNMWIVDVKESFVTLYYYSIILYLLQFNIVFTDGTPMPLCSVRTRNFQVFKGIDCDISGKKLFLLRSIYLD